MKLIAAAMILAGSALNLLAGTPSVPEIDANTAVGAVTLIGGGLLILRARRK